MNSDTRGSQPTAGPADTPTAQRPDWQVTPGTREPTDDSAGPVHTWSGFAGLVVEYGGYGEMALVDPYTGGRLTVFAESGDPHPHGVYAALRKLINQAEAVGFLNHHDS